MEKKKLSEVAEDIATRLRKIRAANHMAACTACNDLGVIKGETGWRVCKAEIHKPEPPSGPGESKKGEFSDL